MRYRRSGKSTSRLLRQGFEREAKLCRRVHRRTAGCRHRFQCRGCASWSFGSPAASDAAATVSRPGVHCLCCLIDPGNFATNIEAGKEYGYLLVWVIVASNLMAMLVQALSAKLGIATGKNLPEVIGATFSRRTVVGFWLVAEVVTMSTDLAEFLDATIGFHLVFQLPLLAAGILTGIAIFLILALQQYGFRPLKAVIAIFVGVIATCYLLETLFGKPDLQAAAGAFAPPRFDGPESVVLAAGILGATVMPHVI